MVTAAGRKVLQKAIFSFWERIPRRKTGELQSEEFLARKREKHDTKDRPQAHPLAHPQKS